MAPDLINLSVAYYTPETLNYLHIVDDFPELARITVPPGKYRTARTGTRGSGRTNSQGDQYQIVNMYPPHPYPVQYGHTNPQQLGSLHTQSKSASSPDKTDLLAPLEYLKAIPPPRRHPLDEEALMSFGKKQPGWVY
ncbi:hypothetical protein H0H87_004272 [Tephrocybe sp. NHM501043]|nr:hypothetical protein H0H87_004272 [Tephrocybe sp. NHM501043]